MAAPRAYWKGHIRLALVSFPVRLYAAVTATERVQLHRIHRETHERIRNKTYVEDEGPVEKDDVVMGYEYDRGKFVPVDDDELEGLAVESKHTIDLSKFVEQVDIDPIYFEKPYFVAPDGPIATEAFVTIRNALRNAGKVALGKIVLSKRERVVAIKPYGDGLLLETLRWPEEVRDAKPYFEDIEDVDVDADTVDMAEAIIKSRTGPFQPDTFVDKYQAELRALIERKLKGRPTNNVEPARAPKSNVINLMDALKASLSKGDDAAEEAAPAAPPAAGKAPAKKAAKGKAAASEPDPAETEAKPEKKVADINARRPPKKAAAAKAEAPAEPAAAGKAKGTAKSAEPAKPARKRTSA